MPTNDPVVQQQLDTAVRYIEQMESAWGPYSNKLIPELRNLGDLYYAIADYASAEATYLRLLTVTTKTYGYDTSEAAAVLQMLGEACDMQGLTVEAERYYLWALDVRQRRHETGPELEQVLARLALLYRSAPNQVKSKVIENKLLQVLRQPPRQSSSAA